MPAGRFGRPEEMTRAVVCLASDESARTVAMLSGLSVIENGRCPANRASYAAVTRIFS